MKVTTAVIFASGGGSRMLPVTSAVQKELLPILNRPVIDYVVSDVITAGITHVIFVVRPESRGLQDYYLGNASLERQLARLGKTAAIQELKDLHGRATFSFVDQPEHAGYGTAVPLMVAAPHLPNDEAVFVTAGDDFIWHADGASETAALIKTFESDDAQGAMMAISSHEDQLHRYGVLATHKANGHEYLNRIVEKPEPGTAPSNLINISKYIVGPRMLPYLDQLKPDPKSGELLITDAIQMAAADLPVVIHQAGGEYLDSGTTASWLRANLVVARSQPELAKALSLQ
jgi:UTP--glucose-1-phosphate uridylyltransferase